MTELSQETISSGKCSECNVFKDIAERMQLAQIGSKNYEKVVAQNKSLQALLRQKEAELEELKKKPFFPYPLNSGNMADFGEFLLVSHAWFTIPNLLGQLGIVEVEWKSSGFRKMYLGVSSGNDFRKDVLTIAMCGEKIKDGSIEI